VTSQEGLGGMELAAGDNVASLLDGTASVANRIISSSLVRILSAFWPQSLPVYVLTLMPETDITPINKKICLVCFNIYGCRRQKVLRLMAADITQI
jgi:hypothetical protein